MTSNQFDDHILHMMSIGSVIGTGLGFALSYIPLVDKYKWIFMLVFFIIGFNGLHKNWASVKLINNK